MSASDDDDDNTDGAEDAQLKQLRAVWVSMREEDPPERGLAALMAAARDKASELAAPEPSESWWQRALGVLRRPPVLALATVTVLLGGALMISQRTDRVTAESTAAEAQERAAQATAEPARWTAPAETAGAARSTAPAETTGSGSTAVPRAPADPGAPVVTSTVEKPAPTTQRPRTTPPSAGGRTPSTDNTMVDSEIIGGTAGMANDGPPATATPAPDRSNDGTSNTRAPVRKPAAPVMHEPSTQSAELAKEADDTPRRATLAQLVKQCESAAARSDCATVKALAKRILSTDAAAYKQRVANNSSIARCLD